MMLARRACVFVHIFDKLGLLPAGDDHRRVLALVTYLPRT
jgi:hypothetical protein